MTVVKLSRAQGALLEAIRSSATPAYCVEGRAAARLPALEAAGLVKVELVESYHWETNRFGTTRRVRHAARMAKLT